MAFAWRVLRSQTSLSSNPSQGGGNETHLGCKLAGLFDAIGEILGQCLVEEHYHLAYRQAVLDAAEAQHIDASTPGDFRRMHVQRRYRIGKTRAIHVHAQLATFGYGGDRAAFLYGIHGADLGRLRDG